MSDGTRVGEIKGKFYGCDAITMRPYPLYIFTYKCTGRVGSSAGTSYSLANSDIFGFLPRRSRIAILLALDTKCCEHPARGMIVNNSKCPFSTYLTSPFSDTDKQVVLRHNYCECVRAAVSNRLYILRHRDMARRFRCFQAG